MTKATGPRRRHISKLVPAALLVLTLAGAAGFAVLRPKAPLASAGFNYHEVALRSMDVTIKKDGELQAVNNIDIVCEVEGITTINSIVKEGATVKKGDTLVELDSSTIRQRIEDTTLDVQKAEADLVTAREMLEIQKSQNAANLEDAHVALDGAQIDLRKYVDADFPQQKKDAETALQMAEIDLTNKQADFDQVLELQAKQFLTPTDVELRRVDLIKAKNAVDSAQTTLTNLENFDREKALSTFKSALSQAEQRLVRVERENTSNLAQKTADLRAKEQALALQKRKLDRLNYQFNASTIKAPDDGLVVYGTSGDRNAQNPIQEGTQVRERQLLLRLPDTSKMKAVVRIQEAQVNPLREGMRAVVNITGISRPITGTVTKISVLPDNSQCWFNPDLKEYPVDIELDETPPGLKPGRGASAEISVTRLENIVAVPVSTIYSSGTKSYVFVQPKGIGDPVPREVRLGLSNETHVEVQSGLQPHDQVLILQAGQGRELLAKAGVVDEPATRPTFGRDRRHHSPDPTKPTAISPVESPTTRAVNISG
jgi:HlyD family secretion protein